jgi:hypothetical protein
MGFNRIGRRVPKRAKVDPASGCWIMPATSDGYSRLQVTHGRSGNAMQGHRVLFLTIWGELPKDILVGHRCDRLAPLSVHSEREYGGDQSEGASGGRDLRAAESGRQQGSRKARPERPQGLRTRNATRRDQRQPPRLLPRGVMADHQRKSPRKSGGFSSCHKCSTYQKCSTCFSLCEEPDLLEALATILD